MQRFLIVDDSPDMRFIISRAVTKLCAGAQVQVACDAPEALKLLQDAGDGAGLVIVSDYDMGPGLTGTQFLSEIAQRHPRAKRVLFTGHAPEQIIHASSEPDVILSKDGGMKVLQDLLAPTANFVERAAVS